MSSENWWKIFERASELRTRLNLINKGDKDKNIEPLAYEEKRAAIQTIKREANELLNDSSIPQPLRMLIVDLWGGPKTILIS